MTRDKIIINDTTLREAEMLPNIKFDLDQKVAIAQLLEQMKVDVIEVGYPGIYSDDFDAVYLVSTQLHNSIICGLTSPKTAEIIRLGLALKPAKQGRIHLYTSVRLQPESDGQAVLEMIQNSIELGRNYTDDLEWSAFDATRSQPSFLYKAIEIAIASGAKTINIPDSLGVASTEEFAQLIANIVQNVSNIDQAIISVHCHNDLGLAVNNSLAAIKQGARQVECSVQGLGARKGNADLATVVRDIQQQNEYYTQVNLVDSVLELIEENLKIN